MSGEEFDAAVAKAGSGKTAQKLAKARPTDPDEELAMRKYGGGEHVPTNRDLRSSGGEASSSVVEGMDRVMSRQSLQQAIVVHRGVADPTVTFGGQEPAVGMEWRDHGYGSTRAADSASSGMIGERGLDMRIYVPRGTRAASNADLFDGDEVVLDRGLTYRVVRDNGTRDGVRQLDVEVVS